MYLAEFRDGESRLVQAAMRICRSSADRCAHGTQWWQLYCHSVETLLATPGIDLAFRIAARAGNIERVLLLSARDPAPGTVEGALRLFEKLSALVPGSYELCGSAEVHDKLLSELPTRRFRVENEDYYAGRFELAHCFRLSAVLDPLFAGAVREGWALAVQFNLCRFPPGVAKILREARKNLLALENSVPPRVFAYQKELFTSSARATYLLDELAATDDGDAARHLESLVADAHERTLGPLGFAASPLREAADGALDDFFQLGLHSCVVGPLSGPCAAAAAAGEEEAKRLLTWRGAAWWPNLMPAAREELRGRRQNFDVFISAKSADYLHAQEVHDLLTARGLAVFFSLETLPSLGSADYRKEIDRALDAARHLVVVTSSAVNASSSWVEAEWGFFINEKRSGRRPDGNLITIAVNGLAPAELPPSLRYYEVIPLEEMERLLRYVRPDPSSKKPRVAESE